MSSPNFAPPSSRNAPCPCRSGKRYKHCHGLDARAEGTGGTKLGEADASTLLVQAKNSLQAGQPQSAERILRQLLDTAPGDAEAWHLLGQCLVSQHRLPQALEHLRRARAIAPQDLGIATTEIRTALALGQDLAARQSAQDLVALHPREGEAWLLLGLSLAETQAQAAVDALQRARSCDSRNPEICFELARLQHTDKRFAEACETLRAGLAHNPRDALLLNNLGLALRAMGNVEEAESAWRRALDAAPGLPQARANLGQILVEAGRHAAALPLLEPVAPELSGAFEYWLSLGLARAGLGHLEEAISAFSRVIELKPDDAKIRHNLGNCYLQLQQPERARTQLEASLRLDPQDAKTELLLLEIAQRLCDWKSYQQLLEKLPAWLDQAETLRAPIHAMVTRPLTGSQLLRAARAFGETFGPLAPSAARVATPHPRLRLGYLTTAIRNHPTPPLITEVLERHDRSRVEVFLYSCGPQDNSPYRPRIAAAVEHFLEMREASDNELTARIRADEIDVLIDLDGYTQFTRSSVFRRRPAPIQINYLGFPGTLGTPCYDYLIADRVVAPPEDLANFSERLLYLPHCYLPSDTRRRPQASRSSRQSYGLAEARFVFCAFNSTYKLTPAIFAVWMRVLRRTPGSVLWMIVADASARENLLSEAARAGLDPQRIVFAGNAPLTEHLARYPLADLFLDTLPCNAHTTCNDALLMGLPVLTCRGETFAGRVAASQLLAVGLPELVTDSLEAYESMAVRLAESPELLAALRTRLAAQGPASPLFDMAAYTRAFETLIAQAHAESLTGEFSTPPRS